MTDNTFMGAFIARKVTDDMPHFAEIRYVNDQPAPSTAYKVVAAGVAALAIIALLWGVPVAAHGAWVSMNIAEGVTL